jgi:hypothetical protein
MTQLHRITTSEFQVLNVLVMGSTSAGDATWGNSGNETDKQDITTDVLMPGDCEFEIENAADYKVGDQVCIKYPTTTALLEALWYGGNSNWVLRGDASQRWQTNNVNIVYNRYVTKVEGNKITVDAPVFITIRKSISQAYIHRVTTGNVRKNIGIENLRITITRTTSTACTTPDQNCIKMNAMEDCWAKNVILSDFVHAGIKTEGVLRTTIENCSAIFPSGGTSGCGSNWYCFENYNRSQLILYKNCHSRGGRHQWVSNGGAGVSGIVLLNHTSIDPQATAAAEGHRYLSSGILFDGYYDNSANTRNMGFFLRDNMGTYHGWGAIHSVVWNCDIRNGTVLLDKIANYGQNYCIGTVAGSVRRYNQTRRM